MITDVGCSMISPAAAALGRIYLDATLGSGGQSSAIGPSFLEPVLIASVDGKNYHQLQQSVRHIVLDKELYSSWGNPTVTLAAAPMVTIERAGTSTGTMLASCTVTGTLSPRT